MEKIGKIVAIFFACTAIALIFCLPIFLQLSSQGIWDWPEAAATYESFRIAALQYGEFLFWNPYMCGGAPGLANPQTYFLSISGLFALLTDSIAGPKLAVFVAIVVGSLGLLRFGRLLGIPYPAVFLAVPLFLASGFFGAHISAGQFLWLTIMWVPWVFWGYAMSFRRIEYLLISCIALALIGVAGRSYLLAYSTVGLIAYGIIVDAASRWKARAVLRAFAVAIGAFLLGAFKFVPDIFFFQYKENILEHTFELPIPFLFDMFFHRPESSVEIIAENIARVDFVYYVGIVPIALALAALFFRDVRRRLAPLLFVGMLFFAIGVSTESTNPFELLPVLRELRNQHRAFIMVLFAGSILAAAGLSKISRMIPYITTNIARNAIQGAIILFVIADLSITTYPLLLNGYPYAPQEESEEIPNFDSSFIQSRGDHPYDTVQQNHGAATFCPAILYAWQDADSVTIMQDTDHYRGEAYVSGSGEAKVLKFTPNTLRVQSRVEAGDVVINYKYHEGWESSVGEVVQSDRGLLAVRVPPGEYVLDLRYKAPGFLIGLGITLATAAGMIAFMLYRKASA